MALTSVQMINTGHPRHGHLVHITRVVTGMVKLGLVITTPSPLRVSCYAHRPKTVTTSFQQQRGFPRRHQRESPHREPPPSSLSPISAPLQKCAIFLWRVFERPLSNVGVGLLGDAPVLSSDKAAAQGSADTEGCRR